MKGDGPIGQTVVKKGPLKFKSARNKRLKRFKQGFVIVTAEWVVILNKEGGSVKAVLPISHARTAFHRKEPARFELGSVDVELDSGLLWLFKAESSHEAEAWVRALDSAIAGLSTRVRLFPGYTSSSAEDIRLLRITKSAIQSIEVEPSGKSIVHRAVALGDVQKFRLTGTVLMIRFGGYGTTDTVTSFVLHMPVEMGRAALRELKDIFSSSASKQVSLYSVALRPGGDLDKRLVIHPDFLLLERKDEWRISSETMSPSAQLREQQRRRTSADKAIARAAKKHASRGGRKLRIPKLRKHKASKAAAEAAGETPASADAGGDGGDGSGDGGAGGLGDDAPSEAISVSASKAVAAAEADGDDDEFTVADLEFASRSDWEAILEVSWFDIVELRRVAHDALSLVTREETKYVVYFESSKVFEQALEELSLVLHAVANLENAEYTRSLDSHINALSKSLNMDGFPLVEDEVGGAEAESLSSSSDYYTSSDSDGSGAWSSSSSPSFAYGGKASGSRRSSRPSKSRSVVFAAASETIHRRAPSRIMNRSRASTGVSWKELERGVQTGDIERTTEPAFQAEADHDNLLLDAELADFNPDDDEETVQRKKWIRRVFDGWMGVASARAGGAQIVSEVAFARLYSKYSQGLVHEEVVKLVYTGSFFLLFLILGWFHFGVLWAVGGAAIWLGIERRRKTLRNRKMELFAMRAFRHLTFDDPIMKALLNIPNAVDKILPPWVQSPHVHQVEWLNILVEKMWPYLHVAIEDAIVERVTPLFEKRPPVITDAGFASCDFGTIPFLLTGLEVHDSEAEEVLVDLDFRWAGNPDFAVWVKVKGIVVTVRITDFQLFGTFRVGLKPLMRQLPGFGAISVSFAKKPLIDFTLGAGKVKLTHLPGVSNWISSFIRQQIVANLVWPQKIIKEIYSTEQVERAYVNDHVPTGMIVVHVIRAEHLRKADLFSSDPYVSLSVDGIIESKKTQTIKRKTSPVWDEVIEFPVPDIAGKRLYLDVFDSDMGLNADDLLGRSEFELYSLAPYQTVRVSEPLSLAKKGSLTYTVQFVPFHGHPDYSPDGEEEENEAHMRANNQYAGFLFCHVKKATALPSSAIAVSATLSVGMESGKTSVSSRANGNKPVWDDKIVLKVNDFRVDALRVEVSHEGKKKAAVPLGVARIHVADVAKKNYVMESAFQLEGVAQGAISMRLIFCAIYDMDASGPGPSSSSSPPRGALLPNVSSRSSPELASEPL